MIEITFAYTCLMIKNFRLLLETKKADVFNIKQIDKFAKYNKAKR